ncbi:hypothetical protein ACS3SW_07020 [Roseobacteraceae bacterium S113]
MTRIIAAMLAVGLVAACGDEGSGKSNPFEADATTTDTTATADPVDPNDEDGDGVIDDDVPVDEEGVPLDTSDVTQNLSSAVISSDETTLAVSISGIDGPGDPVLYTRNAAIEADHPGYLAFTYQDDALDRFFIALGNTSTDGSVAGVAVMGSGQFEEVVPGASFTRVGGFDAPDPASGQVSYAGTYAGITNVGSTDGVNLSGGTAGIDTGILPREAWRVVGTIFINANFSDMQVAGTIVDRRAMIDRTDATRPELATNMQDIALTLTPINDDGTFLGNLRNESDVGVGSYAGIFGGTDAAAVAGATEIEYVASDGEVTDPVTGAVTGFPAYTEAGVFVLDKCVTGSANALCALVD